MFCFDLQDLKNSKPFTKSMEDLMVSVTSHIRSKLMLYYKHVFSNQLNSYITTQNVRHQILTLSFLLWVLSQ